MGFAGTSLLTSPATSGAAAAAAVVPAAAAGSVSEVAVATTGTPQATGETSSFESSDGVFDLDIDDAAAAVGESVQNDNSLVVVDVDDDDENDNNNNDEAAFECGPPPAKRTLNVDC